MGTADLGTLWDKVNRAKNAVAARLRNAEPEAAALITNAHIDKGLTNRVVTSITVGFTRTANGKKVSSLPFHIEAERLKTITAEQVEQDITAWLRDAIDDHKILEQEGVQ